MGRNQGRRVVSRGVEAGEERVDRAGGVSGGRGRSERCMCSSPFEQSISGNGDLNSRKTDLY